MMVPHATKDLSSYGDFSAERHTKPQSLDMGRIEPVAVIGMSFGFPQDATSSDSFWKMLMEQRNTATDIPPDRLNVDAIYHPDPNRRGQVSVIVLLYNIAIIRS